MAAHLIEKNKAKFKSVKVDPITLDLIENAMRNARVEMDATLFRTALSPGIREQGDAFPLIANRDGKMVVGQFGSFIDGFLRTFDGDIEEGDIILLNDPYSCEGAVSHNNDQLIIMPIFRKGRIIAWSAMFGHMTDIGGKVPGSLPNDAQSIFEEGLRMPPVKLYRKGEFQEDILKIAMHQSRMPEWYKADLHAIVASCKVAALRVEEICERFGDDVFNSALDELLARNRRAMRQLIMTSIGEKPVSFEDYICDDGNGNGPFKIKCTMYRKGEVVYLDFDGTDPQSDYSINFFLNENMFKMFFGIYMIMVFDPQVLFNDGFYDLVEVKIPQGSLLKPNFPAALSCRTHALGRIFDVLGALLGQKTPDFMCAAGFSSSPHLMFSGFDDQDDWFQLFQIGFGGIPGKPFGDGPDGHSLWPGFTNVPNEFLERYFPMVIETYESEPDSGGAGFFRGGNGINMVYRFTQDGQISIHDDRWFIPPWGVNGGLPAKRSWKKLEKASGKKIMLGAKVDRIDVEAGDLLHYVTWGGGGWGDPLTRDADLVAKECGQGLLTRKGAKDYGVILSSSGKVDTKATQILRKSMAKKRGKVKVFDYGPDIETLRKNCKKETGLPAPKQPVWKNKKTETRKAAKA
jgi:N-methylhydantoinase B